MLGLRAVLRGSTRGRGTCRQRFGSNARKKTRELTTTSAKNFDFYVAVEKLKADAEAEAGGAGGNGSATSPTPGGGRKAAWWKMFTGAGKGAGGSKDVASPRQGKDRKSAIPGSLEPFVLGDRVQAVFDEYLRPDSPKWVCIDLPLSQSLEARVKDKANMTPSIFNEAQKQVYDNMEKDLLPRFLKSFEMDARVKDMQGGEPINMVSPRGSVRFFPSSELRDAYASKKAVGT